MTNPDNNQVVTALDENTRRYYLDAMGIQCWQLLESENESQKTPTDVEKEVIQQGSVSDAGGINKSTQYETLSRGNESAEMMFVLLSPSANDTAAGDLCSGEEGELLTKMLAAITVSITDVYITSLLQNPPVVGNTISDDEVVQCDMSLKQKMLKVKPKLLIVLGEAAAQFLLKQKIPLDSLRASQLTSTYESIPLFVSYSPAELLQKTENKRKAWLDLQQLQKLIQK